MRYLSSLIFVGLTAAWSASTTFVPKGARCQDYTVPLTVTAKVLPWTGPRWEDDFGFIDFLSTYTTRLSAGFPSPFGDLVNKTARYDISATFCTPVQPGSRTKTVLLATHGLGFDKGYWNSPYEPEKYNFVQFAVNKGYSVFFYDRLGVGRSTKVSGYEAQLSTQIAILTSLAKLVRVGNYTTIGPPTSLVLVGHSFGSFSTSGALALDPSAGDAAILTGYAAYASTPQLVIEAFAPRVARRQGPRAYAAFDAGYVATVDIFATIQQFFKAPAYERATARFADATKSPFAVAELLSLFVPTFPATDTRRFEGPTLVVSGQFDFPICGGFCPGVLDQPARALFAGSRLFESYVQPGAGHGLNFARNATGVFGVVFGFLERTGF